MQRSLRLALGAALVCALACTGRPGLESNFARVRLAEAAIVAADGGGPFSGRLVARDGEVAQLARRLMQDGRFSPPEGFDTTGLVLEVQLDGGQAQGPVRLYADPASPAWRNTLEERLGSLSADAIQRLGHEVKIGEAHFVAGKLEGKAELFAPRPSAPYTPELFAEASFKSGELEGEARQYFAGTQQVSRVITFAQGQPQGPQRSYYRSGQLQSEGNYVAGAPEGEHRQFYADGSKRSSRHFRAGAPTGKLQRWFPTGQLQEEVDFDAPGTPVKQWWSNGELRFADTPTGRVEIPPKGEVVEYHRRGTVHTRVAYDRGTKHGPFEAFYSDGGKWEVAQYDHDVQVGAHRKWYKNGQLALEATYVAGQREGSYKRWYADGTLWEEATYAGGKLVGAYKKWWRNGAVAHDYRYVDGKLDGPYRTFYDNGARWAVGEYVAGKPQGVLRRWFPDGRLGFEQHHDAGRPHGPFRRWWADGSVRLEANYERGRLHGEFKNWLEDGTVYEMSRYEHGRKVVGTAGG